MITELGTELRRSQKHFASKLCQQSQTQEMSESTTVIKLLLDTELQQRT